MTRVYCPTEHKITKFGALIRDKSYRPRLNKVQNVNDLFGPVQVFSQATIDDDAEGEIRSCHLISEVYGWWQLRSRNLWREKLIKKMGHHYLCFCKKACR